MGGGGGAGGRQSVSGSTAQSDLQKTEEAVDHRQNNNYVKAMGTSPLRSNLCTKQLPFQLLYGAESQGQCP